MFHTQTNYTIIYRFLGTTRHTTSLNSTFITIIKQLDKLFNINSSKIKLYEKKEIKESFIEQLYKIKKQQPYQKLIIILDSIDEIIDTLDDLQLFLNVLPDNTKLIISTNLNPLLEKQNTQFKLDDTNYLELKTIEIRVGLTIIENWLLKQNKQLTDQQWLLVRKLFVQSQTVVNMMYLRLIFSIVSKWTSYYTPDNEFQTCFTSDDCIMYIFNSIEKKHFKHLYYRCLFYLTIYEYGVSESELEDILTIDDDLLTNLFQYNLPNVRKFPNLYWLRIKYDIGEYLFEHQMDNMIVQSW